MNSEKVTNRVHSDYEFLNELGYSVVGVFVYGAQNYNMVTPQSDIDTKAIILPHFDDIVDSKDWVSKEYSRDEDGGKLEVKDVRLMFNNYLKQNINFTETLFTKYFELNPEYAGTWLGAVVKNREAIAHYCPQKAVLTMYGNMKTKYKQMFHRAPHNEFDMYNYGYGLKDFHHIARLNDFIKRYIDGKETYEEILRPKNPALLISYKTTPLPVDEAQKIADDLINEVQDLVDKYIEKNKESTVNKDVEEILRKVQRTMIADSLKKELTESESIS